ncbi:MAG TPA: tRNA uridine(34) 5-carboxymethylaminomethyl modification radical SAM/GNAT enzyme Elp3 [Candidatus Acidoferrales bacterium]|nr:tRNA uridine(34) 5-carboxymethylaminomethyl modification radical SAM/GNAT enzyme Elp3 [Candidatus Acidoferrales bacterium]
MDQIFAAACEEIIEGILERTVTRENLQPTKIAVTRRYRLASLPTNSQIYGAAPVEIRHELTEVLQRKPTRTASGVAVVAVMTSPYACPHGKCVPCPGGPAFGVPQSYTGLEPAARRALQHGFDPYRQTKARLNQLRSVGHATDKVDLIVMGGTFTARPGDYQEWFIRRCIQAMNDFPRVSSAASLDINEVFLANAHARTRNVGLTFETRPDFATQRHVDDMLRLGGTKVELGIQTTSDRVLALIERGHCVADSVEANRACRDSGLKVGFHVMPGLPGSDLDADLKMFRELFTDERFCPDYLKIYPTLVTDATPLSQLWKLGDYEAMQLCDAIELVARVKALLPEWVRLQRVQRDIPADRILAGVRSSNLRQLAKKRLQDLGGTCRCIRCREIGLQGVDKVESVELRAEKYQACKGVEYFISSVGVSGDLEPLIGFARLRLPYKPERPEITDGTALVRELHVYGTLAALGERHEKKWQHRGFGTELLRTAERIASDAGMSRIAVTSAIGVRDYFKRRGYSLEGPYMARDLQ